MNKRYGVIHTFLLLSIPFNLLSHSRSIILVPGFFSDTLGMKITAQKIKQHIPDAYIKIIDFGLGSWTSFFNIFDQAEWLKIELNNDPHIGNDCVMIGHSQGGLVARYYVQRYNMPQVTTLITWGTPHQGIFGSPGTLDSRFLWLNILELYAYKFFYLYPIQKYICIAGYWKDPLHYQDYMDHCLFLPHANNEIEHIYNEMYKENIESLDTLVLVNSIAEDTIIPAVSCHFGFYHNGSNYYVKAFRQSEQYEYNLLGLRTLYDQRKLIFKLASCTHMDYLIDEENFIENTLPYLL